MEKLIIYEYESQRLELKPELEEHLTFEKEGWELVSVYIKVCEPRSGEVVCSWRRDRRLNEYYTKEDETSQV